MWSQSSYQTYPIINDRETSIFEPSILFGIQKLGDINRNIR